MKINTKWFAVAVMAFIMAFGCIKSSFAQEDSQSATGVRNIIDLPMIRSQDALRNYALSISIEGSRHVWSQSIDYNWPENMTYTNVSGSYGEEILDKVFNVGFRYRLINPEDQITGYVYLYDGGFTNGNSPNLLFYGTASYTLADVGGKTKPSYNIWMQNVPLPLNDVSSAEILALDENSTTARRIPLDVRNGKILFQSWLAGAPNGIMAVRFNDGSLITYVLAEPIGVDPAQSNESSANYKIAGHYEITAGKVSPTLKIIETWELPTAFVTTLKDWSTVTFDVLGLVQQDGQTVFERPTAMVIEGSSGDAVTIEMYSDIATPVKFSSTGNYRIRFIWNNFGKPSTIYTGPTDGGKG